ncbi:MAG: FecR domain-containing protein [Steroidobacteraceae bacterium]
MKTAEEAVDWFNRLRDQDLSDEDRKRFSAWLAESPVHVREYLDVAEVWAMLHSSAVWPKQSSTELIEAIRSTKEANVVALRQVDTNQHTEIAKSPVSVNRLRWYVAVSLAASFILIGLLFAWPRLNAGYASYATQRGEQRSVVLPDGSVVQMNTLSKLVVRFENDRRLVKLQQGEAFFRVTHDKTRPFDVETPFAVVRAVGTEFNVYNRQASMQVAVVEGRVRVASAIDDGDNNHKDRMTRASVDLTPQQSVDVSAQGRIGVPRMNPDIQMATAWIQRRIALDDERLDTAVQEFNRYNRIQMQVQDPELAGLRISGVFDADDPSALIKYLQHSQGVQIKQINNRFILRRE